MTTLGAITSKRSIGFLINMSMLMLGANLVWVAYNNVLLPTLVEGVVVEGKGLAVGLIGFFGTMLANAVSILVGILSDHSSSKWGRRTPAILIGTLGAVPLIGLASLVVSPPWRDLLLPVALPVIIISYCGMQFFTNVSNGAWWPLLVDVVPEKQRGTASGMQGFMTMAGSAVGIVWITTLNEKGQTGLALWLIAGVCALSGMISAWAIRGKDRPAEIASRISLWGAVRDMFRVRTRVAVFFWVVLALLLAFMGINSLQFFARFFFQVYFPTVNPDAAFRVMGGISLALTTLSAVAFGILSDRIGRRTMILGSMFACAVTSLLMGLTDDYTFFLVLAALRSVATGPLLATAPALASDLAPKDEAGQYMAYNNLSTGLSGALASLIFGVILVTMTRTTFMYLFIVSAGLFLLGGLVFLFKVPQRALDERMRGGG